MMFEVSKHLFHDCCMTCGEDKGRLKAYWKRILSWSKEGALSFMPDDLEQYFAAMEKKGFPPAAHSEPYVETYNPAYRVVSKDLWKTGDLATPISGS